MATYAIGDVQGCARSLEALVEQLPIQRGRDRLWFVGDLVNRGPDSARVLRLIRAAGRSAQAVLGNHDLHLLAVSVGARRPSGSDTLYDVLNAPDAPELIEWLRQRPLAVIQDKTLMVHAGVLPEWSAGQVISLAAEVEARLQSDHWADFLHELYGDAPAHWRDGLKGINRLRIIVNALTRTRYLSRRGSLEMKAKMSPAQAPKELTPWFEMPGRKTRNHRLVVGHWSTLGLVLSTGLVALDTGCVWRGYLTAVRLEDSSVFQQLSLS